MSAKGITTDNYSSPKLVLDNNYEIQQVLGKGTFGRALKAFDRHNKKEVAIKRIKVVDCDTYNEVMHEKDILYRLNNAFSDDRKYIVNIIDYFYQEGHPHLVFEYLPKTLRQLINERRFTSGEVTTISFSILKALSFLATAIPGMKIVHGDLKPENIMFDSRGQLKLIDFGLSFFEGFQVHDFGQSRYYRAPEVYLFETFGSEIDIWSAACIIFECHSGKRLFAGNSDIHQLMKISEILGMPDQCMIKDSPRKSEYFSRRKNGSYVFKHTEEEWSGVESKSLYDLINHRSLDNVDYSIIDLLDEMILYDPQERIKPSEALQRPLFAYNHSTEPTINIV